MNRRVVHVAGWFLDIAVWLGLAFAVAGIAIFLFKYQTINQRLERCPKEEQLVQLYGSLEALGRPLREYEKRRWEKARDYLEDWCK